MLALQHMLYLGIVSWVLRFCSCLFLKKKKKKERKKTQPAAGVNGAYGQCSQIPRERRGLELCSRTVIKHDLVSKLICNAELNIWWCTVFFFLCPISFIENGAVSLDGKAVTMTDAFPGGRSAVAKILGGWGRTVGASNGRRCEVMQRFISSAKSVFFRLCGGPVLQGHWLVFTASVWPSGHDCAHRERIHTYMSLMWRGDTFLRSTDTTHASVNIMHANVHRNRPTNHECYTSAFLQMYFGCAFFCAGSLKMSRHKLTVT